MAMEINGSYSPFRTNDTEQLKEKQPANEVGKAKEKEPKDGAGLSPKDSYISSEKEGRSPSGLYWVGQDENGNRKIFFEDRGKSANAEEKDPPKANGGGQSKPAESCVTDTGQVDREIQKLKERKQQLEQQIQSASSSGDAQRAKELERKLAQVERELSQKDNDAYRRKNSSVSG